MAHVLVRTMPHWRDIHPTIHTCLVHLVHAPWESRGNAPVASLCVTAQKIRWSPAPCSWRRKSATRSTGPIRVVNSCVGGFRATHLVLLWVHLVHVVDPSAFEVVVLAPARRGHHAHLLLEPCDRHHVASTRFRLDAKSSQRVLVQSRAPELDPRTRLNSNPNRNPEVQAQEGWNGTAHSAQFMIAPSR